MKGALVAFLLSANVAAAQPAATARIESAGACELPTLATRSNELLGRAAITSDARARITIATAQDVDAYIATLTFIDEAGVAEPARTISATSCDELADSVAIVISLVLREAPVAAPPPAPPPPAPVVREADTIEPPAATSNRSFELGSMIGSAKEAAIVAGVRIDRKRIAIGGDLAVSLPKTIEAMPGSAHMMSFRLDAAGCVRLRNFAGCGLLIGGLVVGRGEGFMESRTAVSPILGIGLRSEWRQPMSRRLGLRIFATIEQLVLRPSFLVDSTPVYTTPLIQAWFGAGIYLRMP